LYAPPHILQIPNINYKKSLPTIVSIKTTKLAKDTIYKKIFKSKMTSPNQAIADINRQTLTQLTSFVAGCTKGAYHKLLTDNNYQDHITMNDHTISDPYGRATHFSVTLGEGQEIPVFQTGTLGLFSGFKLDSELSVKDESGKYVNGPIVGGNCAKFLASFMNALGKTNARLVEAGGKGAGVAAIVETLSAWMNTNACHCGRASEYMQVFFGLVDQESILGLVKKDQGVFGSTDLKDLLLKRRP
jgi:hypothetical protein